MEPLQPCPRMFPWRLQVPLTAHVYWEEEDPEATLPRPSQQLQKPPHLEWKEGPKLVWLVGSRCFLAFLAQKRPQPRLGLGLPPKSEHSRFDIQQGPVSGRYPQSRLHRRRNHVVRPHPQPSWPLLLPSRPQLLASQHDF